jgi:hypothetical protein
MRNSFIRLGTLLSVAMLTAWSTASAEPAGNHSFENEYARLTLNEAGAVVGLTDKQSAVDYVDHAKGDGLAYIYIEGKAHRSTRAVRSGDGVRLTFGETGATADLKITSNPRHFVIELVAVTAEAAQLIDLVQLPLTLKGDPAEPVAACAMALNLRTNVHALPQPAARLQATAYAKLGFVGAKVAIILCPQARLRDVMKEVVAAADELPRSRIGGPWALDAPANQGSYILECTGNVGEAQIDRWIRMLGELGISQLDFHCGRSFRFGDYTPHPEVFPRGSESVRAVTDKLHAAGMLAGFHTYAFFIAKDSPFVTPVPNSGLAFDVAYTLTDALPIDAATIPVAESTAAASAITGFFIRNSVTLRIDDELIIYKGVRKEAPFGFIDCQRGAHGTKAAVHAPGAKVQHLKEMFGLFVPDPDSSLFMDVVGRTAQMYNEGGFDMIYLDALDGSGILGGDEWGWYHGSRFVFELANRLKKPAIFEMSTFHHHLWYVRSRMGAWDCPARAPKPFIEMHRIVNRNCRDMFLPSHLGWWAIFDWQGIQPERTTPDVIEYLGTRCIADGCGLSFPVGFTPDAYEKSPNTQRLGKIVRQYEDLRRSGEVSDDVRKQLGAPGEEFTLASVSPPRFRPVRYDKHKLASLDPAGDSWTLTNRFGKQPVKLRIEVLLSAGAYDDPDSVVLEDFSDPAALAESKTTDGVNVRVEKFDGSGKSVARLTAERPAQTADGAWAMVGRKHAPLLKLANKGLGFWINGDGRGELLNIQIKSAAHAYGGACDRYVKIDFEGRRYVELIEPESDSMIGPGWPYMPRQEEWSKIAGGLMGYAYPAFHFHVMYDQIEFVNLWYGNLPSGAVSCELSPIKAIPLKPCKLRHATVAIAGKTVAFPVELESGQYLEFTSMDDCKIYGPKGDVVADVKPTGETPDLSSRENTVHFKAEALPGPHPRAIVTVISQGDPL